MDAAYFRRLFDYNAWANERVIECAMRLSPEQFVAELPGLSLGSVRASLVHLLDTEETWLARCNGRAERAILREADVENAEALRERWRKHDAELRAFVASLTDADFTAEIGYRNSGGEAFSNRLCDVLGHVVNHGTQFRSEGAVGLTAFNASPGDLDFIFYVRSRSA